MSCDVSVSTGDSARQRLPEALEGYASAFRAAPWFENTKCADDLRRCLRGFSPLDNGQQCDVCGIAERLPAYQVDELVAKFEEIFSSRLAALYTEKVANRVAVTSISWRGDATRISQERYGDNANQPMRSFLVDVLADQPVVWLDEVFANFNVRPRGNLDRFGSMTRTIAALLDVPRVAFRSINPAMISPAVRDFGRYAKTFEPLRQVPDERTFVLINTEGRGQ